MKNMLMSSELRLNSLRELLLSESTRLPELITMFEEFCCARNEDVERFIRMNAIDFELSGISRTYFYTTQDMVNGVARNVVAAYFAIGVTATDFDDISGARRKRILGNTPLWDSQTHFGGLIIGQFARNERFDNSIISGKQIMYDCLEVLETGRDYVGGRLLYLDCHRVMVPYYEQFGFKLLKAHPDRQDLFTLFMPFPKSLKPC
jgi:hypothetical protein